MNKLLTLILLIFTSLVVFSQKSFVIQNVRLFDGEKIQENMSVLIENGIITKVSNQNIKSKTIISGEGKTLIPALSNAHVHIWAPFQLQKAAKAGVLNVMDMHTAEASISMMKKYKDATSYAAYYSAGAAATVPNGHGTQYGFSTPTLKKANEAKQFINNRVKAGVDYIKIIKEPWKVTLDSSTVKALIKESHLQGKKAFVHVSKMKDAVRIIKNKADGLVHIWSDAKISEEDLQSLAHEKFIVVPTLLTNKKVHKLYFKKNKEAISKTMRFLKSEVKRLYDAKIPILAGTDPPNANINYGTDLYEELILLKEAGLTIEAVLKAATSLPAIHFNLKHKGFIKKGFRADMILIDGNPIKNLKDLYNKKRVFKKGKEIQ